MIIAGSLSIGQAVADSLKNAYVQRIGNYQMEVKTDPITPIVGQKSKVIIRIGSIDGQDLVDTPILIRILRDNNEVAHTDPIFVPYGHYTYEYIFQNEAVYALFVDVNDTIGTGDTVSFEFPIRVTLYDYTLLSYIAMGITAAASISIVIFLNKKRNVQKKKAIEGAKS